MWGTRVMVPLSHGHHSCLGHTLPEGNITREPSGGRNERDPRLCGSASMSHNGWTPRKTSFKMPNHISNCAVANERLHFLYAERRRTNVMTLLQDRLSSAVATPPRSDGPLLDVRNLMTEFKTHGGGRRAVNEVSFPVPRGKRAGTPGESGAGRGPWLRTVLGVQPRAASVGGQVLMHGVDLLQMHAGERERIRGAWLSMIFQDPMTALDPLFTVEQQIVETVRRHTTMTKSEASDRALELL